MSQLLRKFKRNGFPFVRSPFSICDVADTPLVKTETYPRRTHDGSDPDRSRIRRRCPCARNDGLLRRTDADGYLQDCCGLHHFRPLGLCIDFVANDLNYRNANQRDALNGRIFGCR